MEDFSELVTYKISYSVNDPHVVIREVRIMNYLFDFIIVVCM